MNTLREIMNDPDVAPFVRAKAAADLIQFVSRDFKDDTAAQPPKDEEDRPQIPAPTINL